MHGSSPRLRGTHLAELRVMDDARFIPAPAGNAIELPHRESMMAVHPRACGERSTMAACLPALSGSSPRLRGTPDQVGLAGVGERFIPAPAGNAEGGKVRASRQTVHPRACGERKKPPLPRGGGGGSSPRLRGTPSPYPLTGGHGRFIPAPAGNAPSGLRICSCHSVHPRACGERQQPGPQSAQALGSSPRLRGTRVGALGGLELCRFIPAPAGNAC